MAQKQSQAVATAQALTGSYVVANTKASFLIDGESVGALFVTYTTGAAETSNTLSFKIEFSYDGTNWFQQSYDTLSSGVNTLADLEHAIAGASAATTYSKEYVLPLSAKYMRIFFKETGVAANFGTVSANIVLGPVGQSYNHQSMQVSVSLDEFPAAAALTDNFATPTTTSVGAFGMVYDGTTWDFMRGNATDGVYVTPMKVVKTAVDTTVSVDTASEDVVAANASRKGLYITNTSSTGTVSFNYTDAAVLRQGITLMPGATWEMTDRDFTTAKITGIASEAAVVVSVMEYT